MNKEEAAHNQAMIDILKTQKLQVTLADSASIDEALDKVDEV